MGLLRTAGFIFAIVMFIVVGMFAPAVLMRTLSAPYIYTDIHDLPEGNTGLVLGASVVHDKLSPALESRVETAAALYKSGKVGTLLITGAVEPGYDEVTPMRKYLVRAGVRAADIASDSEGFDTYSSVYRAKQVFLADSLIIVTQDFHLPRAIFIARMMHLKAYGIAAPRGARLYDYLREVPASWKAIWDLASGRVPAQSAELAPILVAGAHA